MKKLAIFIILIISISSVFGLYFSDNIIVYLRSESGKRLFGKISDFIYAEATIHNPEGDLLPDQVDDIIKEEIKNRLEIER